MNTGRQLLVASSLVSLGLFSRANSMLYVHSLPERILKKMQREFGGLDSVRVAALREKRENGCTSKL